MFLVEKCSIVNVLQDQTVTSADDYAAAYSPTTGRSDSTRGEIVVRSKLRLHNAASSFTVVFRQVGTGTNPGSDFFYAAPGRITDYFLPNHRGVFAIEVGLVMSDGEATDATACHNSTTSPNRLIQWTKCFRVDQCAQFGLRALAPLVRPAVGANPCATSFEQLVLRVRVDDGFVAVALDEGAGALCSVRNCTNQAIQFIESSCLGAIAGGDATSDDTRTQTETWMLCQPDETSAFGWYDVHNPGFLIVKPQSVEGSDTMSVRPREWVNCRGPGVTDWHADGAADAHMRT